jgi:hypothetical protein
LTLVMATNPDAPHEVPPPAPPDPTSPELFGLSPDELIERFGIDQVRAVLEASPPEQLIEYFNSLPPEEMAEFLRAARPPEIADFLREDPSALAEAFEGAPPDELQHEVRRRYFDDLVAGMTSFVAFVGYSRSGGSIVAALMDAHPKLVVVHELDLFESEENGDVTSRLAFTTRDDLYAKVTRETNRLRKKRRGERVREVGSRY